jgi:hypothetical protein
VEAGTRESAPGLAKRSLHGTILQPFECISSSRLECGKKYNYVLVSRGLNKLAFMQEQSRSMGIGIFNLYITRGVGVLANPILCRSNRPWTQKTMCSTKGMMENHKRELKTD